MPNAIKITSVKQIVSCEYVDLMIYNNNSIDISLIIVL